MTPLRMLLVPLYAACLALPAGWSAAQEQVSFPSRAVQIVVPYTPATGADILARIFGPRLAERWKVAVVTENRAGASGNIGADHVAKSVPDGHTLLCTATSFATNPALNQSLPFDPTRSFAPVAVLATSVLAVLVSPQLPVKTLRELIELARSRPGALHYSSPGNGTAQHLVMEMLKQETRTNLVHVPYKGSGGAMTDVVGGHVQAVIAPLQTAAPYVSNGRLRMLAVMSADRAPAFPDVPTMRELGYPEMVVETWYAMFAPAGTAPATVSKINAELNRVLLQPDVREMLGRQGLSPAGGGPERLDALLKSELARWSRVVAAAGIRSD